MDDQEPLLAFALLLLLALLAMPNRVFAARETRAPETTNPCSRQALQILSGPAAIDATAANNFCLQSKDADNNRLALNGRWVPLELPGFAESQEARATDLSRVGACEYSYLSLARAAKAIQEIRARQCQVLQPFGNCVTQTRFQQNCKEEYSKIRDAYEKDHTAFVAVLGKLDAFFTDLAKANTAAIEKYNADAERLKTAAPDQLQGTELTIFLRAPVRATNGGRFNTLAEYQNILNRKQSLNQREIHESLRQESTVPVLVWEQKRAISELLFFRARLNQIPESLVAARTQFDRLADQEDRTRSVDPATAAHAAADVGTNVVNNRPPANSSPPASSGPSGSGITATGASALPALAMLGAGAAGAAGMANANSGGRAYSSPYPNAPAPTPAAAAPAAPATTMPVALPSSDTPGKAAKLEEEIPFKDELPQSPLFSATSSAPRSEKNAEHADTPPTPTAQAVATAGSANKEEMLHTFADGLKNPLVDHAPSPVSEPNGVNEILGQMKDLLNFDDMPSSTPETSPELERAPAGRGLDFSAGESRNEEWNARRTTEGQHAAADPELETSLFSRVHKRHLICLEKGWIMGSFPKEIQ